MTRKSTSCFDFVRVEFLHYTNHRPNLLEKRCLSRAVLLEWLYFVETLIYPGSCFLYVRQGVVSKFFVDMHGGGPDLYLQTRVHIASILISRGIHISESCVLLCLYSIYIYMLYIIDMVCFCYYILIRLCQTLLYMIIFSYKGIF